MQHLPTTIEEQLLLKAIREECPWDSLPKRLQATLSSKDEWHKKVMDHCIRKRLQWNTCFARKVCKEGEYYEEMMRYLRKNLALFPYHLADYVCRVMRVSPFRYYCDMIFEVMRNEQPYDSIPNFSAADALRLTGVGRNEFIDIMNKCRSKKIMWKLNKSIAKELLPTQPVDFAVEPWWGVCLVNFTLEEFKKLSEEEMATIDKVCKEEANAFVLFDSEIIRGLFRRGLIYFDVPVYPDDRFKGSSLMKTQSRTSVLQDSTIPGTPTTIPSDDEDGSHASMSSANMSMDGTTQPGDALLANSKAASGPARVAFVVDANITSYLMMGSVSPGLKSHAVTLYEAGKLGHTSIADLCKDLTTLEGTKFEGELQEFANHAYSLRCVLECLLSGGVEKNENVEELIDKLEPPSSTLEPPSSTLETPSSTLETQSSTLETQLEDTVPLVADLNIAEEPVEPVKNEGKAADDDEVLDSVVSETPQNVSISFESVTEGNFVENSTGLSEDAIPEISNLTDVNATPVDGSVSGKGNSRRKKKYCVDILRCESLASLAPATLDRLFLRDYNIVVSMIPLPPSSVLPGPGGPIHFGPPSYSSMTPWMKLAFYSAVASGPLSVVLMKGQCLRLLPAPLAGCEKALIWSWDGSSVGGLGGKFEGNLVNGNILLHCLNSLLKCSAVLVQPFSKYDLDKTGKTITLDIPLPLKNADGSVAPMGKEMGLSEEESSSLHTLLAYLTNKIDLWAVGYMRVIKLYKEREEHFSLDDEKYEWVPLSVEFGVPLFSPKLCNAICKRLVSSQLLQAVSLTEHHDAMQSLRKKLRDICAEYQATGPTAKLLYQREQAKEPAPQLINYASGRWNPYLDPSSPISGASSEHQRLKLASRQRCRTEVLSFDGSILRSYALTPVYEAATRPIVESPKPAVSATKAEPDDADNKEVVLPGVNLIFDGSQLLPFEIGACLQARQPISLIAEASSASATLPLNRAL
ncbi:hypothetical protein C5167_028255 [Papaver somniferum]|nr:hypothetical protein C5167_028255 [Papaver somniferum]